MWNPNFCDLWVAKYSVYIFKIWTIYPKSHVLVSPSDCLLCNLDTHVLTWSLLCWSIINGFISSRFSVEAFEKMTTDKTYWYKDCQWWDGYTIMNIWVECYIMKMIRREMKASIPSYRIQAMSYHSFSQSLLMVWMKCSVGLALIWQLVFKILQKTRFAIWQKSSIQLTFQFTISTQYLLLSYMDDTLSVYCAIWY